MKAPIAMRLRTRTLYDQILRLSRMEARAAASRGWIKPDKTAQRFVRELALHRALARLCIRAGLHERGKL